MSNEESHGLAGLRVAVTGVCGTVGHELLAQILDAKPSSVIGIDNNESELFFIGEAHRSTPHVEVVLGDIRDRRRMSEVFEEVDVVFHAAALKHVPLCEVSPGEAIQTNIEGTQNVLEAALSAGVGRVIFTSTDKAVNPTNVMGTSKLMAERLVTATAQRTGLRAISTRFGNVLGSRGSVVPLFARQIRAGGPVTLTAREMTRFVMTLESAVGLVLKSADFGGNGEVLITKMPIARIEDLAAAMIQELAPKFGIDPESVLIEEIGTRPGEKMYEELMNDEETRRSFDIGDFIMVHPALSTEAPSGTPVDRPYNSSVEDVMGKNELADYLRSNGILEALLGDGQ